MSVLIKGIELPNNCLHCPFSHMASDCLKIWIVCKVKDVSVTDGDAVEEGRPNWCPLVEVPPHGRLIDQNALKLSILNLCFHDEVSILKNILGAVNNTPVIIEAEEEGK